MEQSASIKNNLRIFFRNYAQKKLKEHLKKASPARLEIFKQRAKYYCEWILTNFFARSLSTALLTSIWNTNFQFSIEELR